MSMKPDKFRTPLTVLLCLWALTGPPALANDSTASLDTGELVLIPNPDIVMEDEDLFISRDEIRVRYVFRNTSDRTITTPVAFPLPPVNYTYETEYAIEPTDPENFVDFRLWVDGQPANFSTDARAVNDLGQDVTDLLRRNDIPITTFTSGPDDYDRLRSRLNNLSPRVMEELRAARAIAPAELAEDFYAQWIANVAFYWMQSFPAGRQVTVEHRYHAVPTVTFFASSGLEGGPLHADACIDRPFAAAVRRQMNGDNYEMLGATILKYILVTANNWRGSIGHFHLTVDKGDTATLVSLCRSGIRKTGPTTFEWDSYDYRPDRDLTVLFVAPF